MSFASGPAPGASSTHGNGFAVQDTIGTFEGVTYRIDHRDSNSILHFSLQPGYEVKGKPGAMVTMQPSVQIRGNFKFSFKKMVTGGEMSESWFTGPGDVILAPEIWGDIVPIQVSLPSCVPNREVSSYLHLLHTRLILIRHGILARALSLHAQKA